MREFSNGLALGVILSSVIYVLLFILALERVTEKNPSNTDTEIISKQEFEKFKKEIKREVKNNRNDLSVLIPKANRFEGILVNKYGLSVSPKWIETRGEHKIYN